MSAEGAFSELARCPSAGIDPQWADVCGGDIDGDGDVELVSASNLDAHIVVFEREGDLLDMSSPITGYGAASDWASLACADLEGDGVSEVVGSRNFDGSSYLWWFDESAELARASRVQLTGASLSWGPMGAGRLLDDWPGDWVVGASGRTGRLHAWVRP